MQNTGFDKGKDKKRRKSVHPLDVWPPPPKQKTQFMPQSKRLPKNKSFVEKDLLDEADVIVYDREVEPVNEESEQTDKNRS